MLLAQDCATAGAARTWESAVRKWQRERSHRTAETVRREDVLLGYAGQWLKGREVGSIRRADLERIRDGKIAAGAKPRTANYAVQAVSAILRAAARWEWIGGAPALEKLYEGPQRERYLTEDEATSLLLALPAHLRVLAAFSLETGLRQGNAKRIEWRHVQWARNRVYLPATETKNRKPLVVPLTPAAREILERSRGLHPRWVFTWEGQPIRQPTNTAWYGALRRVGLSDFRWHDLRHTWATWHVEAGTHLIILQRLGGWSTPTMLSRYTHLNDDAAQAAVQQFAARRSRAPEKGAA